MNDDDALQLYIGLVQLLQEAALDGRLDYVVESVEAAVAQGRPSVAEVKFSGQRHRERVQRVEPLTPVERLKLLVDAIEFALVIPVDLAVATAKALATEQIPQVDLVFERDVAIGIDTPARAAAQDQAVERASVTITTTDIAAAQEATAPLRIAIAAIRAELDRK